MSSPEPGRAAARNYTTTVAALLGLVGFLTFQLSFMTNADVDMWHEMSLAREAVRTGGIPHEDSFAYTPTVNPTVHHEWGTGIVLCSAAVATGWGAPGIMALKYLLTATVCIGCFICARRRGSSIAIFATLAPLGILLGMLVFSTVRAQLFTVVFLIALLLLLEEDRRGARRWVVLWLPLYVVWLNMHAGFLAGAGVFALHVLERFLREWRENGAILAAMRETGHLILTGIAMAGLIVVNPYGLDYFRYLWFATRLDRSIITEWAPLWRAPIDLKARVGMMAALGFSGVLLCYAASTRGLQKMTGLLALAVSGYLAIRHTRHITLYAVIWVCYAPSYIEETGFGVLIKRLWRRWSLVVTAVGLATAAWGVKTGIENRIWEMRVPTSAGVVNYPAGAVDYLDRETKSRQSLKPLSVFVPFNLGAFVSWKLDPRVKVSLDSRYEVAYPPDLVEKYVAFYRGEEGSEEIVERFPTDCVLLERGSKAEALLNRTRPDKWVEVYKDDVYALYVRRSLAGQFRKVDNTGKDIVGQFP